MTKQKWLLPFRRNKKNYEDIGVLPYALEHDRGFAGEKLYTLTELQKFVGGYIELTKTVKPRRDMWLNEEGLIHDLPINAKTSQLIDPSYWTDGGVRGDVLVIEKKSAT